MFSSVNLNLEFSYFYKMGWELRIKKFVYYGCSLKNLIWSLGLVHKKDIGGKGEGIKKYIYI